MYDYYVQAISYGVETPLNGFYIKLTPFHDIYSPEAPYYPASSRTLVWLTRLWEFPENIQPTIITHTWPADDIFPTDSAIYWSPAKENSHQVSLYEQKIPDLAEEQVHQQTFLSKKKTIHFPHKFYVF